MIYLYVAAAILAYRLYIAGQTDFTYSKDDRYRADRLNFDLVANYIIVSIVIVVFWPILLPCYGIYKLGQRFKKDKKDA